MRSLAHWLAATSVPDPELQCELVAWAMILTWLADVGTWWSSLRMRRHSMRLWWRPQSDPDHKGSICESKMSADL